MEFDDVLSEDLSSKLPPMCEIQHVVSLIPGASLSDLSHSRLNPIEQTECKRQVDELLLEIKQQFIVPSDVHFYEDKFWSYIMMNNVGMIKGVIIYNRSISKIFEDAVMREHGALQTINFSFITVKLLHASPLLLPVCITFIFTVKPGKLSHTFRIIPIIILFGRGRVYY